MSANTGCWLMTTLNSSKSAPLAKGIATLPGCTSCTKSEKMEKVSYVEAKYLECAFNGGHGRSSGDSQLEGR